MAAHDIRQDAAAALGARRELGDDLEPAVVDSFAARMERAIEERVQAQTAAPPARGANSTVIAIATAICAIPLTGIAAGLEGAAGLFAVLIVWIGLVALNVAHARGRRS